MKKIKIKNIAVALVIILLLIFEAIHFLSQPKTAYISVKEVYDGFDMKKEFEKKYLQTVDARQHILDSLATQIKKNENEIKNSKKGKVSTESFNASVNKYYDVKKSFMEDNEALSKKYDEQIMAQLNQYIKEYGDKCKYTYIFGTTGDGTIMYAKEKEDITKEVVSFVNKRYRGE